jgi:ubiquinone/menaquinone biosynthesis C-methylase UbiE
VLDLGTGPGDVAFQVAEMVGADDYVVGVDQDAARIAAEQRRTAMGVGNVAFRQD